MSSAETVPWQTPDNDRVNELAAKIRLDRADPNYSIERSLEDTRRLLAANEAIDQGLFTEVIYRSPDKSFDFHLYNIQEYLID